MSFENIGIRKIWQINDRTLGVQWTDDRESKIDVVELRRQCPCAVCVDEWTHEKKLKPSDISDSVRPVKVSSVGRYAVNVQFSDQHGTGIYTYQSLRNINLQ